MRASALLSFAAIALAAAIVLAGYRATAPCTRLVPEALPPDVAAIPATAVAIGISRRASKGWFPLDDDDYVDADAGLGPFVARYTSMSYHGRPDAGPLRIEDPASCDGRAIDADLSIYLDLSYVVLLHTEGTDLYVVSDRARGTGRLAAVAFRRIPAGLGGRVLAHGPALAAILAGAVAFLVARRRPTVAATAAKLALLALAVAIVLLAVR